MSINLSVVFYGKGVPRRVVGTCVRQAGWQRSMVSACCEAGWWRRRWCIRGEWRCSSGVQCWGPRATAGGRRVAGAGCGSVHSPLTRARGERRSRSVRRLKVAHHVTPRVLNPLRSANRRVLHVARLLFFIATY